MIARSFRRLCLALALSLPAFAAVFQYKVTIPAEKGEQSAFLWVPPAAPKIRGVLMAGQTLMEKAFSQDPQIRAACAEQGIALVFTTVGLKGQDLQKTLDDLAAVSGFAELSKAPLFFVGHSAGGPQALDRAKEFADRCFGLMQFRGGIPYGLPAGIPAMAMMGQFDEFGGLMRREDGWEQAWMGPRRDLAKLRSENPGLLACFAAEAGAGHFAWTERNGKLFALFLTKAAATVIRPDGSLHRPAPAEGLAVPLAVLPNDPADLGTAWVFDAEMSAALEAYHAPLAIARKDQFLRWDNAFWVDAGVRYFFNNLKIVGDGQTFEVNPVYADKIPGQHNNQGPRWLQTGEAVANSGAPIGLRAVAGPIVPVGPKTFRLQHDALNPVGDIGRITFMAYSEGNEGFRNTEIVGMAPRGYRGPGQGADQTLDFPELQDQPAKHAPIALNATSSSGLPVEYYVAYGPAAIEDGKLVAKDVPARASGPIEVSVVAYHIGSGIDPKFKAAVPVVRTYRLLPAK